MAGKLKPPDRRRPTCFGMPHKGFFPFFVVVNMLQTFIVVVMISWEIKLVIDVYQLTEILPLEEKIKFYLRGAGWVWGFLHSIVTFVMDVVLFRTANLPNTTFLRAYVITQCISLPLLLILVNTLVILGTNIFPYLPVIALSLFPAHVLYRLYTSYVVYRYSRDIDFEQKMKSGYRSLTEEEVGLFEHGFSSTNNNAKTQNKSDVCYDVAKFQAYDREKFEINRKDLDFSEATTLGCGEYGMVYKVHYKGRDNDGKGKSTVAVKTVDPEMSDVNQFKALLAEAKVMMYMGRHENIVGLIGVCTEDIRKRKLFIVCELCEFGNLRVHLRSERNTFVNLFGEINYDEIDVEQETVLTTFTLLRWATEIAAGMEFLGSKKIIHGDLAARNVLLTLSKTAKITDFGLSRRLYNYSVYNKRNDAPLPWRWLALESLIDMNFATGSDVWSYATCCWEIFEMGAKPWPEFLVFTSDFIEALKDGKMQCKAQFCSEEIYQVMCLCWNKDVEARPSFTYLKEFFSQQLEVIRKKYMGETKS